MIRSRAVSSRIARVALAVLAAALVAAPQAEARSKSKATSAYAPAIPDPEFKGRYASPRFGDHKPVRIKGRKPHTYPVHGIDISRYQRNIDWAAAKKAGVEFVFIKATEGKDNYDRLFRKHWADARKHGIARSAYHFYYFCASPEAQARNFIRRFPKEWTSLPPVLDLEWNHLSPSCKRRPKRKEVVRITKKWLSIVEKHYGQKPIIYLPINFYRDNFDRGELKGYQYWLRSVKAHPSRKFGDHPFQFWQYSGTGRISGYKGEMDLNAFNGTREDWRWWVAENTR